MASMSQEGLASRIRDYLETLQDFTDDDVEHGCSDVAKLNCAFPPSSGQIYHAAEKWANKRAEAQRVDRLRLAKPDSEHSEAHREDMKRRFSELVAELVSGVNFNPEYGLVPKGTKPDKPVVTRTVPGSFMEKWERENGREYPGRDRVTDIADYREAAE